MLRVRLVGFQHALEDIERGMLERPQTLDRFLLHARRCATVQRQTRPPGIEAFLHRFPVWLEWAVQRRGSVEFSPSLERGHP
jgi:hypothetical protein